MKNKSIFKMNFVKYIILIAIIHNILFWFSAVYPMLTEGRNPNYEVEGLVQLESNTSKFLYKAFSILGKPLIELDISNLGMTSVSDTVQFFGGFIFFIVNSFLWGICICFAYLSLRKLKDRFILPKKVKDDE